MSKKVDFSRSLPSNIDTFTLEELKELGSNCGVNVEGLTRKIAIQRIRRGHSERRLRSVRKSETEQRRSISVVLRRNWAQKRLMKDLKEIRMNKLDFVAALPLRNNLFEWHVNLLSPKDCKFFPMVLHLVLHFDHDYPRKPPRCELKTSLQCHSHVFGSWICLDLLETHRSTEAYSGWSSSYSVLTILFQLQSFLFEEQHQYSEKRIKKDIERSFQVSSCHCGHNPSKKKFFPVWEYWEREFRKTYFSNFKAGKVFKRSGGLRYKRLRSISQFSSLLKSGQVGKYRTEAERERKRRYRMKKRHRISEMKKLRKTNNEQYQQLLNSRKKQQERELRIRQFKLKLQQLKEEEVAEQRKNERIKNHKIWSIVPPEIFLEILSFLDSRILLRFSTVNKFWRTLVSHPYLWKEEIRCFHTRNNFREDSIGLGLNIQKRGRKIHQVSTLLDLISKDAFENQKIKKSPWNVPFTHWCPIFIDPQHFSSSIQKKFEDLVMEIYEKKEFEPHLAADLCCRMMTSQIVEIMKGDLHGSIKAIQGYAYFYRLLLWAVAAHPYIMNEIEYNIGMFRIHEKYRYKRFVPNLGDFISLMSVSELFSWEDIRDSFLEELFDRNAYWIEKKREMVKTESGLKNEVRIAFECIKVSLKFTLFHLSFLRRIRKGRNLDEIIRGYDRRYGKEDQRIQDLLQQDIFRVNNISSFNEFFRLLGREDLADIGRTGRALEDAKLRYRRRGYNRRINTSGCILTGKFRRSMKEVKVMVGLVHTSSTQKKKKRKKRKKKSHEEEEEGDIYLSYNRSVKRRTRGGGRRAWGYIPERSMFVSRRRGRRNRREMW